MHQQN